MRNRRGGTQVLQILAALIVLTAPFHQAPPVLAVPYILGPPYVRTADVDERPDAHEQQASNEPQAPLKPQAHGLSDSGYSAETNYVLHCQGCHGADGIGFRPKKIPPLRDSMGHFLHVPGGRRFLIQVPGVAHAPLTDTELAALLNFTLERYSADQLPRPFPPYTEEEVARTRREPTDIPALRAELISMLLERHGVRMWTMADPVVPTPADGDDVAGR